jgi:hydroxypyruvate isomerase
MRRRQFVTALAAAGAVAAQTSTSVERKGRLKQCVTRGVFARNTPFEDTCRDAARLGCKGYDLIGPADWPTLKKFGLIPTMYPSGPGGTIPDALNRKENHDRLEKSMHAALDECAANSVPNLITFSGNRRGMTDDEGAENCVALLNRIKAHAEDKRVTVCMELLNSKVDHKDYMCDHTAWGVQVVQAVNSPNVKLLYDIYHMQIMEGDMVRTIQQNIQWLGHFHTGGVPGRHELDGTQEVQWDGVMRGIAAANFHGYVAHEFVPTRDPLTSLRQAVDLCDV